MNSSGIRTTGLLIGLLTGILTTLFDGVMLWKLAVVQTYIPNEYPIILFVFNLLVWIIFGGISGSIISKLVSKNRLKKNETFFWTLFFLVPFAAIYGIFGKIPLPLIHLKNLFFYWPRPPYDHHLSILFVIGLLGFCLIQFKTSNMRFCFSPLLLGIEISVIVIFLQFCSNPSLWMPFHYELNSLFVTSLKLPLSFFNLLIYVSGVIVIFLCYLFVFFKVRPLLSRWQSKHLLLMCFCLFLFVVGLLYYSWITSHQLTPLTNVRALKGQSDQAGLKPNVFLFVLDTVRADRLSVYNKSLTTSPNLEDFAKDSLVFERCIAPSSWTVPSHASLFSGLYNYEHHSDTTFNRKNLNPLDDTCLTLAEILQKNGYQTAAIVSNITIFYTLNLFQGFQYVDIIENIGSQRGLPFRPLLLFFSYISNYYPEFLKPYRTAPAINRNIINLLAKKDDAPFFLFVNYMDTHSPNLPPNPFNNYFLNKRFPRLYGIHQFARRLMKTVNKTEWDSYALSQYDAEIAFLDQELGKLLTYLKKTGKYDSSLIIITSDHGELLGEHELYDHHGHLYEETIRVPLMVKFPRNVQKGRILKPISLTDVYATILASLDLPIPNDVSSVPFGSDGCIVSEVYTQELGEHKAIYDWPYKYMEYKGQNGADLHKPELYDLSSDPGEKTNLIDVKPDKAVAMRKKLQQWKNSRKRKPEPLPNNTPLPENMKEKLRALGYVH